MKKVSLLALALLVGCNNAAATKAEIDAIGSKPETVDGKLFSCRAVVVSKGQHRYSIDSQAVILKLSASEDVPADSPEMTCIIPKRLNFEPITQYDKVWVTFTFHKNSRRPTLESIKLVK